MKHGTKISILGAVASMALALLSGCDRGVAPECAEGDTTCVATNGISAGTGGKEGTGSGGAKPDTVSTEVPGSSGSSWNPVYDTGVAIKSVAKADFVGVPDIQGGDARRIAFHVVDSTLHITASSDGATQSHPNRETIYELQILSTDSIQFDWDSKTDNGLAPSAYTAVDPLTAREPHPLYLTVLRMPVIANALRAHLTARRGSTFMVWVKARSGQVLSGNAVATPEDSLPRLKIAETKTLLFSGAAQKPIPSDPFSLQIP